MDEDIQWFDNLEDEVAFRLLENVKVMAPASWALELLSRLWWLEPDRIQRDMLRKIYFDSVKCYGMPPEFVAVLCCIYRSRI
jgi:hypothetical protein